MYIYIKQIKGSGEFGREQDEYVEEFGRKKGKGEMK